MLSFIGATLHAEKTMANINYVSTFDLSGGTISGNKSSSTDGGAGGGVFVCKAGENDAGSSAGERTTENGERIVRS